MWPEPGTTLTPRPGRADGQQELAAPSPQPREPRPTLSTAAAAPGPVAPPSHDGDAAAVRSPAEHVFHDPEPSECADAAPIVSVVGPPTSRGLAPTQDGLDHVCTPADFVVGAAARFEANLAALALLKDLESEARSPTREEQAVLARFSGFGDSAFEAAFRLSAHRPGDAAWVERGQRLRSLLSQAEWQSLERSRLNAFFTSPDVVAAVWDGLLALGLRDLTEPRILEPAAGVGRVLGLQPPELAVRSNRTAVELDSLTARLLKALYPRATVHAVGFQDAPLRDDFFDVAVSNVPFGDIPVVDRAFLSPDSAS